MDIEFLLLLQEFREGAGGCLADFFAKMTFLAELNTVLVIMAVVYWCVSKDFGAYLMMGWSGNRLVNGVLKITACVYRPWIRDARIVPYGNSMTTATGYSFPSGHTTNAGSVYGGVLVRKDMPKMLRIIMGILIVLVALSRNFLGVHTPQDVLVGGGASILTLWLVSKLMEWLEVHPEKDVLVLGIGFVLAAALALYAGLKQYPVDYDAAGNVLVDGAKMAKDTFKGVGWCVGFLVGWILERRFVNFSTDIPAMQRIMRLSYGLLGYYVVSLVLVPLIPTWIAGPAGTMLSCFFQMLYIAFIYPWLVVRFEKRQEVAEPAYE